MYLILILPRECHGRYQAMWVIKVDQSLDHCPEPEYEPESFPRQPSGLLRIDISTHLIIGGSMVHEMLIGSVTYYLAV